MVSVTFSWWQSPRVAARGRMLIGYGPGRRCRHFVIHRDSRGQSGRGDARDATPTIARPYASHRSSRWFSRPGVCPSRGTLTLRHNGTAPPYRRPPGEREVAFSQQTCNKGALFGAGSLRHPGRVGLADQPWRALRRGLILLITKVRPRRRTTCEPGWFLRDLSELRTFMAVSNSRVDEIVGSLMRTNIN